MSVPMQPLFVCLQVPLCLRAVPAVVECSREAADDLSVALDPGNGDGASCRGGGSSCTRGTVEEVRGCAF